MKVLDWIVLAVYFAIMGFFIFYKKLFAKNMKEFATTATGVGIFAAFASLTGSYIGPGYTMGLATQGFLHGIVYFFIFLGFSLQTFLVGNYLGPKLNHYKHALTLGDVVGEHYGKTSQILTGVLSFIYCVGIAGVVTKAAGSIGNIMTGIDEWICILFAAGIVLIYTMRGGMKVVIGTDIIQFSIIVIGIIVAFIGTLSLLHSETIVSLPEHSLTMKGNFSLLTIIGLFIGFLFGETLVPPYAARALITKEASQTRKAFIYSSIFSVLWFGIVITIGIIGKMTIPNSDASQIFLNVMMKALPMGLLGLVFAAIISTIMSTQDSYLNSAAVSFTRDIWLPLNSKKEISDSQQLNITKLLTLIVAIFGIVFAIIIPGLIEGILIVYTFWAPTIIIPVIAALLFDIKHPSAAVWAISAGAISSCIWQWVLHSPFEIPSLVPGIFMNLVVFFIVIKIRKV